MSRPTYAISREIGAIAVFIGRLLQGLFISLGRKATTDGIPKVVQLAYWLKRQTIFLLRKLNEVGIPKVLEAGQISKGLIILATRNLKAKGYLWSYGLHNQQVIYPVYFIKRQR